MQNLNSIMILLIQIDYVRCTGFIKEFKFHYDSINSYSYLLSRHLKPNLNSIMILLIPNAVIDYGREKTI